MVNNNNLFSTINGLVALSQSQDNNSKASPLNASNFNNSNNNVGNNNLSIFNSQNIN